MFQGKRLLFGVLSGLLVVTGLHFWLNFDWSSFINDRLPPEKRKLNVAYIPVT